MTKPTIAQLLYDKFDGREHFTSSDILTELPGLRLQSAQSIICRYHGKHFDTVITGVYRVIGERPADRIPPGRKKGGAKFKNPKKPILKQGISLIVDWMNTPIKFPISLEGWRK